MVSRLASGIGGTLFPGRYLADRLEPDARAMGVEDSEWSRERRRLAQWWDRVAASCGPASGIRALFDLAAMPLFAMLGFRASDARFERGGAQARLHAGDTSVALLLLPWAARPSAVWRRAVRSSGEYGAAWCFVLAPPFLSLVGTGATGLRRSLDFSFPAALESSGLTALMILARSTAFERRGQTASRLERLVSHGALFQDRVRSDLQRGVVDALIALAPAIRQFPANSAQPAFDEALTILYRVLFLLFAESRDLVPCRHPVYRNAYSVGTLCRLAERDDTARGLWDAIAAVSRLSRVGCRVDDLIVRPFNGRLFARAAAPTLERKRNVARSARALSAHDRAMQRTLTALATRSTAAGRQDICYADLGVEQLGAVYERVLDLDRGEIEGRAPAVPERSAGHSDRRKESGTFYTPQQLAEFVVRRTLAPLVAGRSPDEILALRVVDPAMGSGAFLVAACHYLASAYERALVEEGRCLEADIGAAEQVAIRRLVAERCLAGVDLNPVAVQLARLSLWLATLAEGKPLSFLDHRLRAGNSLVGASAEDLRRVRDRRSRRPADAALPLFDAEQFQQSLGHMTRPLRALTETSSDTIEDIRAKEKIWAGLTGERSPLTPWRLAMDLWCARWFWPDRSRPPSAAELRAALDAVVGNDATLRRAQLAPWLRAAAAAADARAFFHWPLEFADIFYDESGNPRANPGFDAVIGNPPWEMLRDDGANAGAAQASQRRGDMVRFIRESGLYPSCDRGHVNLYQPFLERALALTRAGGRVGLVLPWGLAVDDGAAALRTRLLDRSAIDAIVGLDNANAIFPIHRSTRFMLLVASPGRRTEELRARFGVTTPDEIARLSSDERETDEAASYPVRLSRALLARAGGPSRRIPDIRHAHALKLLDRLSAAYPPVGSPSGWHVQFGRELNITEDRPHFSERGMPVVEGKHVGPFHVRAEQTAFHITRAAASRVLPAAGFTRARLAYRDVSGASNRLSLIAAIVPADVVTSHTLFCLRDDLALERQHFLCAVFNSFVLNTVVRMLMGGHVTTSLVEMLPVPIWDGSSAQQLVARLAARLADRGGHRAAYARMQGAVARMYSLDRDAFRAVLDGFPLVSAADRALALTAFDRHCQAFAL
jgi:hypothetical protein